LHPVAAVKARLEQHVLVVVGVERHADADLTQIVQAPGSLALFFGPREGRQEHAGQDGDNSDDHQQLDQGESWVAALRSRLRWMRFHR
jgi:hypothetical protein